MELMTLHTAVERGLYTTACPTAGMWVVYNHHGKNATFVGNKATAHEIYKRLKVLYV